MQVDRGEVAAVLRAVCMDLKRCIMLAAQPLQVAAAVQHTALTESCRASFLAWHETQLLTHVCTAACIR
jgi:hypothetical protein